ncbi:helix-turn-helix domain-containing protein [Halobacteriovorax sp. RZ-2]|uniref:helix-turn-helix domain-containing protein n=1 Tax=unclassified Halobacteriovorax TaxID=2639665 RepID=UPI003712BA81
MTAKKNEKKQTKKKNRRCDLKVETREGKLLKYLRESRNLSVRAVGRIMGISESTVSHSENGRRDLTKPIIASYLDVYGYSYEEFEKMLHGDIILPENMRGECIEIIKRLEPSKLRAVKAFLNTFIG